MKPQRLPQLLVISVLIALLFPSQTILAQAPCQSCSFRFVVYGDTRNPTAEEPSSLPRRIDGEIIHAGIVAEVVKLKPKPALVLQTGDLVRDGLEGEWTKFDEIIGPFTEHKIAYYPARGNHDIKGKPGEYEKRVKEPFLKCGTKTFYAFVRNNIRFISIDTQTSLQQLESRGKPGLTECLQGQYAWLENELKEAKDKNQFAIPFFHKAIYSIGYHSDEPNSRAEMEPLFIKFGVKLVFQGHDHLYYHVTRSGIDYVVAGGGGAPLNVEKEVRQRKRFPGDRYQLANNFLVCDVYADRIAVSAYTALKPLEGGAYTQFEQFTVCYDAAKDCKDWPPVAAND